MGTSGIRGNACSRARDHPHACGDKQFLTDKTGNRRGSSPRVWGQELAKMEEQDRLRIIPTRVGTRLYEKKTQGGAEDHPHACGDKHQPSFSKRASLGSSPRVWGQAVDGTDMSFANRIIPTRVGTSLISLLVTTNLWDHPHACGDKLMSLLSRGNITGSSPRVWGQASSVNIFPFALGIIPTRVGTSAACHFQNLKSWIIPTRVGTRSLPHHLLYVLRDHPHACGDKPSAVRQARQAMGSSPRVWGQGITLPLSSLQIRIIPTRVGTS